MRITTIALPACRSVPPFILLVTWTAYIALGTTNGFAWIPSWHDEQRAIQVGLLLLVAILLSLQLAPAGRQSTSFAPLFWVVIWVGLISSIVNGPRFRSIAEVALLVSLGGLALMTATCVGRRRDAAQFVQLAALLIGTAHVVGVGTRYLTAILLSRTIDLDVLLLGYANPRFQSALYLFLLPFIGVSWLDRTNLRSVRLVAAVTGCLLWSINAALQTRAIFVAFAAGAVVLIYLLGWKRARQYVLPQMVFSLVGLLLYGFLVIGLPTWLLGRSDVVIRADLFSGVSGREVLLAIAWQAIESSPLLGIGPMNFAAIPNNFGAHPHNWIAQLAAEFGLPVTLLVCLGIARFVVQCGRTIRSRPEDAADPSTASFAVVVIALIYGLADGIFVMPVSQSAFAITLGVLIGSIQGPRCDLAGRSSVNAWASTLAALGASLFLVGYAAQTLTVQADNAPSYRFPRFWENGMLRSSD